MTIRLGIVMDPIENIHYKKDSSLAMLLAASKRDWQISYMLTSDMYLADGEARAKTIDLSVHADPGHWFDFGEASDIALADLHVILMRKDPPFDNEYIYSTYILERAEQSGCLIVNSPQSLRDCNEKVFATQFKSCCPPTLVSANMERLKSFHQQHQDVIYKPLDGMGGSSIFRVKADDPNISVILETLTAQGNATIMAQGFIPDIINGDKRILLINGEPIPYTLARIPAKGETRGNLAAGGHGEPRPITKQDRWICEQIAPTLKQRGLIFVGIDVIGDFLTEINVTSPTCIRELDAAYDLDIGGQLLDFIEKKLHT